MKIAKLTLALAIAMFVSSTVVTSCKKKTNEADTDVTGSSDNALADHTSSDIIVIGSQASDNTNSSLSSYKTTDTQEVLTGGCATVTRDTVLKTVTVTFNGGSCLDGRTRSGSLVYNYSASTNGAKHYRDPGFSCTVTSNNYVVDGNQVNINNKTITNTTPVGFNHLNTNLTWSISANITINKASGGSINWVCNRVKTLLNSSVAYINASTPINWPMARIGFTGSANGTRSNGETFTVNITNQLIRDFGACTISGRHPFIEGDCDYSPSGKATRHIDYGNGSCDLNATVTINGTSHNITLP